MGACSWEHALSCDAFSPPLVFVSGLSFYQVYLLVGITATLFHLGLEVPASSLARRCLGAFGLLAGGTIRDILHANAVIETAYIASFTLVGFVLLQSGIIAGRNADAYRRADRLSGKSKRRS